MQTLKQTLLFILAMASMQAMYAQIQKGADINGEASGNQSGYSVSMPDANTVAIGAPNNNNGNGSKAGHVRIYTRNGTAWVQKGADIDGEAADDNSGQSVTMPDANTVAIGAYGNDGNGTDAGHVRIYTWSGSAWTPKGADIEGAATADFSGQSVSMPDANTVAIGAYGNAVATGQVRIYSWSGSAWVQKGADINGETSLDFFGYSVSMPDVNTVAIGAYQKDGNGTDAGQVRIYSWSGSAWIQKGSNINGEAAGDKSGNPVSMPDANTVAIGAPGNDGNGTDAGHVRIYTWSGSAWVQKGADINGEAANDNSGQSVTMPDANTVAIGAISNAGNGISSGHVRIYKWNGSVWVQKGGDIDGEAAFDYSGWSVSMPDTNTVAIGAVQNDGNGASSGHVRVYQFCTSTTSSISPVVCYSYTSPSGKYNWTVTGAYMDTVVNTDGCDSIITINLTVHTATSGSISPEACYSYTSPSGKYNWTVTGAYKDTLVNTDGCDSIITINLTVHTATSGSISPEACYSYTSPSGKYNWTANGTYTDTVANTAGCDSIITIYLTIKTVDVSVTNASPTLTANASGATYRWLNCNTGYAVISGQTSQSFTATSNGNYAVEVTQNGCTDTSTCLAITTLGVAQNSFDPELTVFPNPTNGKLRIHMGNAYPNVTVLVINAIGQQTFVKTFNATDILEFSIEGGSGIYFVELTSDNRVVRLKIMKE